MRLGEAVEAREAMVGVVKEAEREEAGSAAVKDLVEVTAVD